MSESYRLRFETFQVRDLWGVRYQGVLSECYEAYPTLATVKIGHRTGTGLYLLQVKG